MAGVVADPVTPEAEIPGPFIVQLVTLDADHEITEVLPERTSAGFAVTVKDALDTVTFVVD